MTFEKTGEWTITLITDGTGNIYEAPEYNRTVWLIIIITEESGHLKSRRLVYASEGAISAALLSNTNVRLYSKTKFRFFVSYIFPTWQIRRHDPVGEDARTEPYR